MAAKPTVKRRAAGIVFCPSADGFDVALLGEGQQLHLPQVDVEPGVSPVAAAVQAVWEATRVRAFAGPLLDQVEMWSQVKKGDRWLRVQQLVDYFLLEGLPSSEEHEMLAGAEVHWLPIDEAISRAFATTEREMLTRARSLLRAPGGPSRLLPPIIAHALGDLSPATLLALAETELWVEDDAFIILALPSSERPHLARLQNDIPYLITIDDGDELTLILAERWLEKYPDLFAQSLQSERSFRFIRLEANLPWDSVGYGAAIFAALAAVGVSAGFYSGYSIDYLLVKETHLPLSIAALERLIREAAVRSTQRAEDGA